MTYGYMGQNPYYQGNIMSPYTTPFVSAMHQNYGQNPQIQQQSQSQPQQQQTQQITTQPPILQPQASASKITPVSNREEATASPVDLVNGTPSFFFNKEKNEVYYKQFDVLTGKGIFKTYVEAQIPEEPVTPQQTIKNYEPDFEYIKEGIAGLYRKLDQIQPIVHVDETEIEEEEVKPKGKKHA
jgi:hypothetical protein